MVHTNNSHFDALVFDLGKVIVDFDSRRALEKLEGKTPLSLPDLIFRLQSADALARYETGALSSEDFYKEMAERLTLRVDFEEFTRIWSDIFSHELILDESFFAGLKPHYTLILLSNTNAMHTAYLKEQFPILRVFDHCVFSHEVGAMKPSERIYRRVMDTAQASPERIFYVDDVPDYVTAAAKLGWVAVPFRGKAQLLSDMRQRGIQI